MVYSNKKTIKKSTKKNRVRWDRVFTTAAVASALTFCGVKGIKALYNKLSQKDSIYSSKNLDDINDIINDEFDNFSATQYYVNDAIGLYIRKQNSEEIIAIDTINENQQINVYNMHVEQDDFENEYYYCEIPNKNQIGLINVIDLEKANKISVQDAEFNQIYIINSKDKEIYINSEIGDDAPKMGFKLDDGEIIFADLKDAKTDQNQNVWIKMRTNLGKIGYVKVDDSLKKVDDGVLVEVRLNPDTILENNISNLNQNTDNMLKEIETGDRMVVIENGKSEDTSLAIYFDDIGNARYGEISNKLLKLIDLTGDKDKLSVQEDLNDSQGMNLNISNWLKDYQSGYYGIDISSSMKEDDLKYLLDSSPDIKFGIVRIGTSGFGHLNNGLVFVESSTVIYSDQAKELVTNQVETFKNANIPVFAYFYATDTNVSEGEKIAEHIEYCIDAIGGDLEPIVDCEMYEDGWEDRMYFLNNPNYESYLQNGGKQIDLDYIRTLDEINLIDYVDSHPEVQEYINYCQDQKAQSLAYIYCKLYKDGYISGKNAILYSGNKSISKDNYKAIINQVDGGFEKIVLFKYDDVVEYLTNPDSPYYISRDFNLKIWYADYTANQNFQMLGDGAAIAQYEDRCKVLEDSDSEYDKNYACPEFIDSIVNKQKNNIQDLKNEVDELELE